MAAVWVAGGGAMASAEAYPGESRQCKLLCEVTGAEEALSCCSPRVPGRGRPRAAHTHGGVSPAGTEKPRAHCGGPIY